MNATPSPPPRRYSLAGIVIVAADRIIAACSIAFWSGWTRLQLALLGHPCGRGLRADGRLVVRAPRVGAIRLGDNVRLNSRRGSNWVGLTQRTILQCLGAGSIQIGHGSGLSGVVISSRSRVVIGERARLGGNVRIYDHDFHALDPVARREYRTDQAACRSAPVEIGDDVLVGANAIILKGVTIGARSIVGAGSVVARLNIPPDSIVVGNPARLLPPRAPTAPAS